jgi:hypothetical protein
MIKRFTTLTAILTSAVAMAAGGVAFAATHHAAKHSTPASRSSEVTGIDTDSIQSGDQTTPDTPASAASAGEEESGEVPGNDGPGGHEDEPGSEAEHEFEGEE